MFYVDVKTIQLSSNTPGSEPIRMIHTIQSIQQHVNVAWILSDISLLLSFCIESGLLIVQSQIS